MDRPVAEQKENSTLKDWLVPIAIAVLFLVWGLVIFFIVTGLNLKEFLATFYPKVRR